MGTKANPGKYDCYHAAKDDEPIFTLLGRDVQAAQLVRDWAARRELRLRLDLNNYRITPREAMAIKAKIDEALDCAKSMARYYKMQFWARPVPSDPPTISNTEAPSCSSSEASQQTVSQNTTSTNKVHRQVHTSAKSSRARTLKNKRKPSPMR